MLKLDIIYEDKDILVINKESGIVVNTSTTSPLNTLQETLAEVIEKSDEEDSEFDQRSGIVHRLDKDTSGVILIAKNIEAFTELQRQFKERQVKKEYFALVLGKMDDEILELNAPIARHPHVRTKLAIVANGKEAVTKFEKIKEIVREGETLTFVKAMPLTGRTHQIRVHLCALNLPIIGDPIYMSTKQYYKWLPIFNRLMLHACKIEINHPTTKERMTFEAPLPQQFLDFV